MKSICFLSGLEIRSGKKSREHYFPKSKIPHNFYSTKQNVFPADKVINEIKDNLKPCQWEEKKFDRVYYAIKNYDLRSADRDFCKKTLENWETYRIDPCSWCIMQERCGR